MTSLSALKMAGAALLLCAATAVASGAQTFKTLTEFNGLNGAGPQSPLVQGADGSLYGTTSGGGHNTCSYRGCGTVFRITAAGTLDTLYSFCSLSNCSDGISPVGLILADDGNFYGTTADGGTQDAGTVFRITPDGTLTTLYRFCTQINCSDGADPLSGVIQATDGNFYGTTYRGGKCSLLGGCGTVFKITPSGNLTTLYSFCPSLTGRRSNCLDGAQPQAGLVQATSGDFYGTTASLSICGGAYCNGTVFRITRGGKLTTLHSFDYGTNPAAALVQVQNGNFYGTTFYGGNYGDNWCGGGCGTVFKMTPGGTVTTLYSFEGMPDGGGPAGALVQATDGDFYGTTYDGGPYSDNCQFHGCGTVFRITPEGVLTTLHSFDFFTDGGNPDTGLLQATEGTLYGASWEGGRLFCIYGCGTVFSLDVGLGPFVTFVRPFGKVGQTGGILGQGFTGTTNVSLNGTPADFTVVSDTYIRATIPIGGTTGYVTVTTPTGTLTSNVPFHVIS